MYQSDFCRDIFSFLINNFDIGCVKKKTSFYNFLGEWHERNITNKLL